MADLYNETNPNYDTSIIYRGIPKEITSYMIKTLDFQPEQTVYELYSRFGGKMSTENLKKALKIYNFSISDTINLSKYPIKNFVSFLVGINNNGQIVIIGDANNNYNFADDKMFLFDSSFFKNPNAAHDTLGTNLFHYQYAYNGNVLNKTAVIRMSPVHNLFTYSDSSEQKLYLVVYIKKYTTEGVIKTKDSSLHINAVSSSFPPAAVFKKGDSKFYFDNDAAHYMLVGDTMHIEKKKYIIDSISYRGDSLFFSYAGKDENKIYGTDSGEYAYNITGADIVNKTPFELNKYTGKKYLLLDFWGSWCSPCMADIPNLVSLSKRFKNNLQIISIAEDNPSHINTIKNIIKENKMDWIHLYEDNSDILKTYIAKKYKIRFYPTINAKTKRPIFQNETSNFCVRTKIAFKHVLTVV